MQAFADQLAALLHIPIAYQAISEAQKLDGLSGAGLPPAVAQLLVRIDQALSQGALDIQTADFRRLTRLEPWPLADFITQQLASD